MKAQSELAGDRKRRAEMTRPRFVGVTIWIARINGMNSALRKVNSMQSSLAESMNAMKEAAVGASFTARISESINVPALPKPIVDSEVNHRPAGR